MGQVGIAFVRGLNFFCQNRITAEEMSTLLREIEDDHLHIIDLHRADNIIFEKVGMHYAEVGLRIQMMLQKRFGKEIMVTTRSINTVKGLMKKLDKLDDQNL
ncbi:MAG: DUF1697 domain-containing protein [Methanosarcinales archaeon]|nr:DUF1697 domain-containing protein [Methanosarcinales archaeon]